MRHSVTLLVILLFSGVVFTAPSAEALPLLPKTCAGGTDNVVDRSMRLADHIIGCNGSGLVITKSGVTLDLNRKSISGNDTPGGPHVGITIDPNVDRVTIKNGWIDGFDIGINADETSKTKVTGMLVQNADGDGIRLATNEGGTGNSVRDVTVRSILGVGIRVEGVRATVTDSNVLDAAGNVGIDVFSTHATVLRSRASQSGTGFSVVGSQAAKVLNNVAALNTGFGFQVLSKRSTVQGNDAINSGSDGFFIGGPLDGATRLFDNRAYFNASKGFNVFLPEGTTTAARNLARDNGAEDCIPDTACNAESPLTAYDPQPGCGDAVTTSGKLTDDIENCSGDGLTIDTPNITLDLNGFEIGDNNDDDGEDFGIKLGPLARNVKIINGSIAGFEVGIGTDTATPSGVRVSDVVLTPNADGIDIRGDRTNITRSLVLNNLFLGIRLTGNGTRVIRSIVSNTGDNGIEIAGNSALVSRNIVVQSRGINVLGDRTRVIGNGVNDVDSGPGIDINGRSALVKGNDIAEADIGISVLHQGGRTKVTANDVYSISGAGIDVGLPGVTAVRGRNRAFDSGACALALC